MSPTVVHKNTLAKTMNLISLKTFRRNISKFIDHTTISIRSGTGGNGSGSFARDNFTPRGKSDGGNGGDGGNIFISADTSLNNLNHLKFSYQAENGANGTGNGSYGARGKDTLIPVPLGTVVHKIESNETESGGKNGKKVFVCDCDTPSTPILIARGGKGGRGNRSLRTNNHTHEKGIPGDEFILELDMNTIADVGLVGLPNAGKSSFLSSVSRTSPKIAPYPFTTLHPNVGITNFGDDDEVAVSIADVPGLIEGAHQNIGLGHEFLKHVIKSRSLFLVLDVSASNPIQDGMTVINELNYYQKGLASRISMIVANKIDRLANYQDIITNIQTAFPQYNVTPYSAKYKIGIELIHNYFKTVKK